MPRTSRAEAPLLDHLEELRWRLVLALLCWALGSGLAWMWRTDLLALLERPLSGARSSVQLVAMNLTDQLFLSLAVALWGGVVLALPPIAFQMWLFVAPGLYPSERRLAVPFVLGAGSCFAVGVAFAYLVVLPYAVPFLVDFLDGAVVVNLNAATYVSQVLTYLLAFGLLFELPVLAWLLARLGLVDARMLTGARRPALLVILVVSAVITPTTDPVNLLLMAGPLYVLYELSIVIVRFAAPREGGLLRQV